MLADTVLTAVFVPRESVVGFYVTGVVLAALAIAAISAPLWLAWRLVGATRHYARLIVVLVHQVAIAHLVVFLMGTIILAGLELRSMNSVGLTLDEAMQQGSASAAFRMLTDRLVPLFDGPEVMFATGLSMLVMLSGAVWMIRSWGGYRDAFGLSRRRSLGALVLFVLACQAGFALFGWLASAAR